ncbi:MAG TPA: hypothetical protein VG652_09750 [Gaiellaceae bacterium]|nr:hypothetical protein [Gaiellaceae bacterium]
MNLERLAELSRQEEAAVEGRRWEDLLAIQKEQLLFLESLPNSLPREALEVLQHALVRCSTTQQSLFAGLAETKGVMERLRSGSRAIVAYGSNRGSKVDARA